MSEEEFISLTRALIRSAVGEKRTSRLVKALRRVLKDAPDDVHDVYRVVVMDQVDADSGVGPKQD